MNTVGQRRNKLRRTFHTDPTQEAVLGYPKPTPKPRKRTPEPTGGAVILPEALNAATMFGLHPYQVAEIIRRASQCKRDQFEYLGHAVDIEDNGTVVAVTRIQ
jgi:hypothetical protein